MVAVKENPGWVGGSPALAAALLENTEADHLTDQALRFVDCVTNAAYGGLSRLNDDGTLSNGAAYHLDGDVEEDEDEDEDDGDGADLNEEERQERADERAERREAENATRRRRGLEQAALVRQLRGEAGGEDIVGATRAAVRLSQGDTERFPQLVSGVGVHLLFLLFSFFQFLLRFFFVSFF